MTQKDQNSKNQKMGTLSTTTVGEPDKKTAIMAILRPFIESICDDKIKAVLQQELTVGKALQHQMDIIMDHVTSLQDLSATLNENLVFQQTQNLLLEKVTQLTQTQEECKQLSLALHANEQRWIQLNTSYTEQEQIMIQLKQELNETKIQLQNAKTTQESLENILQIVREERNQFEIELAAYKLMTTLPSATGETKSSPKKNTTRKTKTPIQTEDAANSDNAN